MQTGLLFLLAFVASTAASANEFGDLPQVKEITNGQPEQVAALIERIVECNHWGGEEPYDMERAEQIRKAVEKARCDSLDSDEQALEQSYKGDKKVLEVIGKAKKPSIRRKNASESNGLAIRGEQDLPDVCDQPVRIDLMVRD